MRPVLALAAALLATLLAPAGASAYMSPGEPVADAAAAGWLEAARTHWGAEPSCGEGVRLDRAERIPSPGIWAAAELAGCHISLDPDFYPAPARWTATPAGAARWAEQMCNVVVHEWGHLLGRGHAEDARDLMAPAVPLVVPGCRGGGRLATAAAPTAAARRPAARKPRRAKRSRRAAAGRRAAARRAVARRSVVG